MDEFNKWLAEAKEDVASAVSANLDGGNERQRQIMPIYIQYRMFEKTNKLVKATWALAILTAILAIITLITSYL